MSEVKEKIDYDSLAEKVVSRMVFLHYDKTSIWSGDDCASYLRITPRQFKERTCRIPNFPEPLQIQTSGTGFQKRWKAQEVVAWANQA